MWMQKGKPAQRWVLAVLLSWAGAFPAGATQSFTKVNAVEGITGQTGLGQAVAWADIDNDGDQDLAFSNQDGSGFWLYRNDGNGFAEITTTAGLNTVAARKLLFAEITGDDWVDLVVVYSSTSLWKNDGDNTFTNITGASGVGDSVLCLADFNNDGAADVLTNGAGNDFSVQFGNGDGTFDSSSIVGSGPGGFSSVCFDYDLDGLTDFYVGTGYGGVNNANQLFRNNGDGSFTDVSASAGVGWTGATHGLDVGDYDNDGRPDLYLGTHSAETCDDPYPYDACLEPCVLYRNKGDGTFEDKTVEAGVGGYTGPFGDTDTRTVSFSDYDHDGWLDIFVSCHNFGPNGNAMWHNNGDGTFTDTGSALGLAGDWLGDYFSVGWADYNGDGANDIFAAGHVDPNKYVLYRNDGCPGNFLMVDLVGIESNRSAIGARATVSACGSELTRFVTGASGRQDFNSLTLDFGLDACTEVTSLEITWPSGAVQLLGSLSANQHLVVSEDSTGQIFSDGFESGDLSYWSVAAP
ncbi:MAG: CRTAC1 family protein [Acidobacteriota bacterium]